MLKARKPDWPKTGSPPPGGHPLNGSSGCGWISKITLSFRSNGPRWGRLSSSGEYNASTARRQPVMCPFSEKAWREWRWRTTSDRLSLEEQIDVGKIDPERLLVAIAPTGEDGVSQEYPGYRPGGRSYDRVDDDLSRCLRE